MDIIKKITVRVMAVMLCITAMLGVGGLIYQFVAQSSDLAQWPAPGRLVDVDGDLTHIYCQGIGSPTVVVEQGNGGYYDHWHDMNSELSRLTRVCAYDRAGMGYSDSLGRVVKTDEVAQRLHKLLIAADITDDLILVGWSAGGIHVRNYYKQFPDKVAGMILVDSSHEQQQNRMSDPEPPQGFDAQRILAYLGPFGVIRLSGQIDRAMEYEPGSDEHKQRTNAVYNQSHWARAYFAEFDAFNMDQNMNRTPPSLGNISLTVLTRGKEVKQSGILQDREKVWQEMQNELAALSSQGKQIIASESGHSIHLDQPELVFNTAQEMLLQIRSLQGGNN
jgi:pimeloyl-ACP methyl ester carboxylesterase